MFSLLAVYAVTIHISSTFPTPQDPKNYDIGSCSGVFISGNEILTAAHCFSASRNHQWVKTDDDKSYEAKVESIDFLDDLAVVVVPKIKDHPYVRLGKRVGRGDHVYTVNSGDDIKDTYNEGVVNNLILDPDTNVPEIMHSASIDFGASGSGLFDKKGRLVGINTMKRGPFGYAVDIAPIRDFLNTRDILP